ncbi:MAG: DnaJ C-terminal domain-containing protein [Patescibacteria group bacterium]
MTKDYYQILGIDKKASKEDIKKAFHKLAHRYHPDKKGGDTEKFKEVSEAYSILSDDKKRAEYDSYGRTFSGTEGAGYNATGFDFSNFANWGGAFEDAGINLGDIFGDIFGGGTTRPRGRDISLHIEISFREGIFGATRKVLAEKTAQCEICRGSGAKPETEMKTCATCSGNGKVRDSKRSIFGAISVVRICETCHGAGKIPKEKCSTCHGAGIRKRSEEITLAIPPGLEDGEVLRMEGMGDAVFGGDNGDLYVKIRIGKHPSIEREGVNLVMNLNIKLSEALLGSDRTIETLDGPITLKIPSGIAFGEILRISGKGVLTQRGKRGDFLVRLHISLPKSINRKTKEIIEKLREEGI